MELEDVEAESIKWTQGGSCFKVLIFGQEDLLHAFVFCPYILAGEAERFEKKVTL